MTYEEAKSKIKEILKREIDKITDQKEESPIGDIGDILQLNQIIQIALEMQEKKKPEFGCLGEMLCPECYSPISYCADFRYSEDWCPHCGQAIDWRFEE